MPTLGTSNLSVGQVVATLERVLNGVAIGSAQSGTTVQVAQGAVQASATITLSGVGGTASTGSYALSGVGGTAASNAVTLGGGAGDVTIVTDGTSVGPVPFNTSDAQTATDCITALNADGTFAAKATASSGGSGVITITWDTKGTVGNSKTLTASRTAGTATVGGNGTTLGGGAQGAVTVEIDGTSVGPVDTTNLTDTAAATAVAAAIEADATLGPLLAAVGSTTNVNITWGAKGTAGDAVTMAAGVSATGTATRSGATLSGGVNGLVEVTLAGVSVVSTNTTNLTDTAAATAVKNSINGDVDASAIVTATSSGSVVTMTATAYGELGNAIEFLVATDTGSTAPPANGTLSGGSNGTSSFLVRP